MRSIMVGIRRMNCIGEVAVKVYMCKKMYIGIAIIRLYMKNSKEKR